MFQDAPSMDAWEIDNDTRGWIMCMVSAIACMVGASIICVDIFVRLIPSQRNFRIERSESFKSSSYGFSFGVLLFSALYSILPSSKKYLIIAEFPPKTAAFILMGGFVAGFIAIGMVSRVVHSYTHSKEVGCTHKHEGGEVHGNSRANSHASSSRNRRPSSRSAHGRPTESTPLILSQNTRRESPHIPAGAFGGDGQGHSYSRNRRNDDARRKGKSSSNRRPSMLEVRDRVMSFVKDKKTRCDSGGPCYGYTGVCGQQCFKEFNDKTPTGSHRSSTLRNNTNSCHDEAHSPGFYKNGSTAASTPDAIWAPANGTRSSSVDPVVELEESDEDEEIVDIDHHHHVADNPYAETSLQTSIAIALHKLPEGFMTYATNHANPNLGWAVFMALFVHNITEGFALALPIYLASRSRVKALIVTAIIGGAAQPIGAGLAALWFKIAGKEGHAPGTEAYGIMFAITAGVMTNVALMLFKEGMDIGHNRESCIYFAFFGMTVMMLSNALTS